MAQHEVQASVNWAMVHLQHTALFMPKGINIHSCWWATCTENGWEHRLYIGLVLKS